MSKDIREIVINIMNDLLDSLDNGTEDSPGLSLSEEADDQLPCSEDFQFFMNIARTAPSHSPGSETETRPCQVLQLNIIEVYIEVCHQDSFDCKQAGPTPPDSPLTVSQFDSLGLSLSTTNSSSQISEEEQFSQR